MNPTLITKQISVNTTPDKIWHVFINPQVTKQMGGEYVSDWKEGSSIGWKGKDGQMYTRGTILSIKPAKLLKHNLHDLKEADKLLSVITYQFEEADGSTVIHATEELNYSVTEDELEEITEGWEFALEAIKEIAEKLK
jgi:hypothetical protein